MPTPKVSAAQFDEALSDCLTNEHLRKPGKPRWNQQRTDQLAKDFPELAALFAASVQQHPDSVAACTFSLNLAAVLHRAYQSAGAHFALLAHLDVAALLQDEQKWLAHLQNLPPAIAHDKEVAHIAARPNGEVLQVTLEMLRDFAQEHPFTDKARWPGFIQIARINLGVAHAALNAASAKA
jgi:hypothetical protein